VPPSPNPSVQRRRLSFGAVVRARRKALGLSQDKLAAKAGCDRQSINRVENSAYSPSLDRVFKLADALGLSLSELFDEFDRVDGTAPAGQATAG
jgi:transcriptional regulator with XRE-family HTH domain